MHLSPGPPEVLNKRTNARARDPLERLLLTQVDSVSRLGLDSAVGEMTAVISCHDRLGASAAGNRPDTRAAAVAIEDLSSATRARCWGPQDRPMKRRMHSIPLSLIDSSGLVTSSVHRGESFDNPKARRPLLASRNLRGPVREVSAAVRDEIKCVNRRLIDTEVEISEEGMEEAAAHGIEGVVVTCSYKGAAIKGPTCNTRGHGSKLLSLPRDVWLLIPPSYPDCSPVVWSEHLAPNPSSSNSASPAAAAAPNEFTREVRALAAPISLEDVAGVWDRFARQALADAASFHGGGTFSSSIGQWESFVRA